MLLDEARAALLGYFVKGSSASRSGRLVIGARLRVRHA
jgi:hypothetical protein